jgi:DNA-binding PadR family transcriptional regulator
VINRVSMRQRRVLRAVHAAGPDVSGYDVFLALRDEERPPNHGRVFAALRSLTARGYLRASVEQSAQPTVRYSLTAAGEAALQTVSPSP